MKFEYDRLDHDPPAPFLQIRLSHPLHPERIVSLPAKVDTGADVTGIPFEIIGNLGLEKAGDLEVMGFEGQPTHVEVYAVRLELPSGKHGRLNAFTMTASYVLLGRDVLNQLRLLLDGPARTLEILPPP
jgi:predicted aspartyl protease